ncbi:hypothetical protein ACROYT_G015090 [Oculina patagonica]
MLLNTSRRKFELATQLRREEMEVKNKQTGADGESTKSNAQAAVRNDEDDTTTESVIGGFIGKGCIQNVIITNLLKSLKTCCLNLLTAWSILAQRKWHVCMFWSTMLTKEPYKSDYQNVLHLVELLLVLPISSAQCERAFSTQNCIKSAKRSCLETETTEDLIYIYLEGPSMAEFVPSLAVDLWFSSGEKPRRPFYNHQ